jgi:hypothetical protein
MCRATAQCGGIWQRLDILEKQTIYSEILHILSGSWAGVGGFQDLKLKIRVHVWDITCAYLLLHIVDKERKM